MCYSGIGGPMKNIEIIHLKSFKDKFLGLMGKKDIKYGVKIRCNGIHTFFMKMPIDVVLTDKNNIIINIIYNVKPWKIILPKKNIYYTYEFPVNIISYKIGDKINS